MLENLVAMATNSIMIYGKCNTKTGSHDNVKSAENIFMKLKIWVDGCMEIMHVKVHNSSTKIIRLW
jgi:hypothetical protein